LRAVVFVPLVCGARSSAPSCRANRPRAFADADVETIADPAPAGPRLEQWRLAEESQRRTSWRRCT
jgi:hypothetical protein